MTKAKRARSAIAHAIREARFDLRLNQRELAERLEVSRETICAWETGRTEPPLEQRQRMLDALEEEPHPIRARTAEAFGLTLPPTPLVDAPAHAPDPAAVRASAVNVVRAVADDLDLPPSAVRKTLAALFARLDEAAIPLDALRGALSPTAAAKKSAAR